MSVAIRSKRVHSLTIDGREFSVEVLEIPFREGVELCTRLGDEQIRVSDRGLGEHEALRILEDELRRRLERAG